MNKKKRTRYLLLAVVLIYITVIWRFLTLSNDEEYVVNGSEPIASFTPKEYKVKESFTITNDYRDPFLGTLSRKKQNATRSSSLKRTEDKKEEYFPTIKYLGIISDPSSAKKVLSLQINTKEYIAKEGRLIDSVKIISGTIKRLTVSYKGKRKHINISD